jgi:hypothetical protein
VYPAAVDEILQEDFERIGRGTTELAKDHVSTLNRLPSKLDTLSVLDNRKFLGGNMTETARQKVNLAEQQDGTNDELLFSPPSQRVTSPLVDSGDFTSSGPTAPKVLLTDNVIVQDGRTATHCKNELDLDDDILFTSGEVRDHLLSENKWSYIIEGNNSMVKHLAAKTGTEKFLYSPCALDYLESFTAS